MDGKIWTAEELEALPVNEQDALFRANIVRDLDDVPPDLQPLLDRVRARVTDRIAGRDLPNAS